MTTYEELSGDFLLVLSTVSLLLAVAIREAADVPTGTEYILFIDLSTRAAYAMAVCLFLGVYWIGEGVVKKVREEDEQSRS